MITAAPFFCFIFPNTKIPGRTTWNLCVEMYITTKGIEKSKTKKRQYRASVLSPLITFRFRLPGVFLLLSPIIRFKTWKSTFFQISIFLLSTLIFAKKILDFCAKKEPSYNWKGLKKGGCRVLLTRHIMKKFYLKYLTSCLSFDDFIICNNREGIMISSLTFFER